MDFGLTGETLGTWKGIVVTLSVVLFVWALWPDMQRIARALIRICARGFNHTINVRFWSDGKACTELTLPSDPGLLHRIPLKDDGLASIIEIDSKWVIRFIDMPSWEHFWFEDQERAVPGFRRYVCRYIPAGDGYKEAKFIIEVAPEGATP